MSYLESHKNTHATSGNDRLLAKDINVKEMWLPSASAAETLPRDNITTASSAITAGSLFARRIQLDKATYSTVTYAIGSIQGVTMTNTFFGIYDTSYNLLASSADLSTSMAAVGAFSTGTATLNYTTANAGDYFLALLVGGAATLPTFATGPTAHQAVLGLSPNLISRSTATNLTALPNPGVMNASIGLNIWLRYA